LTWQRRESGENTLQKGLVSLRKIAPNPVDETILERRVRILVAAGMFAGLLLSPKLWLSDRLYPLTPLLPFSGRIPEPFDLIVYGAMLAALAVVAIAVSPSKAMWVLTTLAILLALCDQSRWQPWFYQYLVMLLVLGVYDRGADSSGPALALHVCRFVICSIYFWSGAQKIHTEFFERIFPWLIAPFGESLPRFAGPLIKGFGFLAPFLEMGIGIALLTQRFRRFAIIGALAIHTFILLCIGPLGRNWNNVVWPWNLTMMGLVVMLFWKQNGMQAMAILWPPGARLQRIVLVAFGIAPVLSFVSIWDDYLSSSLYAGYRNEPILEVTNGLADRLPKTVRDCVYLTEKPGVNVINLLHWSLNELNVANYPEPRVYRRVAKEICSYATRDSEMKLTIRRTHVLFSRDSEVSYDCGELLRKR
jgi:uncharacterized membrane protein YphA (DoxX/SURF4 family)